MKNSLLAQLRNPVLPPELGGGAGQTVDQGLVNMSRIISAISAMLLIISLLYFFLVLVTGGINWMTSEGDKSKLESARNKITHGMIGLIIVAAAWAIFAIAGDFIGIDIENIIFPTFNDAAAPSQSLQTI